MASWGGGRARGRQNDRPWRRGWSQFNSSILTEGSPKVNLTECFVLSGTQSVSNRMSHSVAPRLPIPNPFSTECLILLQAGCLWAALFQQISFQSVATKLLPHNATDSLEFRRNEAVYRLPCCNRKLFLLQTAGLALGPDATDSSRPYWHLQRSATDSTRAPWGSQPYIRDGMWPEGGTGLEGLGLGQGEGLGTEGIWG